MSQSTVPPPRRFIVTLVGLITLLYGLACVAVSVLIYVKGNEGVDELIRWLNRFGFEASVSASGDPEFVAGWYRTFVLLCASCFMLWGLPVVFAAYRVLSRRGRVLAIVFGVLACLGGGNGVWSAVGPRKEASVLIPASIYLAYGLLTVITLIVCRDEFPISAPPTGLRR